MDEVNNIARAACSNLLINLECDEFYDSDFCIPFMKYVSSWAYALPITTIIIGQNPYPQAIYPEYGAALSYDEMKCRNPPGSVKVIAEDLFNNCGTSKEDTINCFRDLWRLTEKGVIAINETVFSKIVKREKNSNLRPMRETEFQIRALQVLISESYFMGQTKINCIGMGMSAAMMTNIMRQWCPNDLITLRVFTCSNPAALAHRLGDLQSLPITFGNTNISKVLSSIVEDYLGMAPKKDDKRAQQNIDAFKANTENVVTSAANIRREYSSFVERLKSARKVPEAKATLDDLEDSLGALVNATDNHSNTIRAHMMSFVITAQSMTSQKYSKPESVGSTPSTANTYVPPPPVVSAPITPSRRVVRRPTPSRMQSEFSTQSVTSIKEEPTVQDPSEIIQDTPPRIPDATPSRIRRPVARRVSKASSVTGTEYTAASITSASAGRVGSKEDINPVESVHIRAIGQWFAENMGGDTTYSEMIETTASEGIVASEFSRRVLAYVRTRISMSTGYDAYEELRDETSETSIWCKKSVAELQ
jgi:uracil DNA glycosylase